MNGLLMAPETQSFESFLVQRQFLSEDLLRLVYREMQKEKISFEQALLSLHLFNEQKLASSLAQFSGLPLIELPSSLVLEPDLSSLISWNPLSPVSWIPFKKEDKTVHIALADPLNKLILNQIKQIFFGFSCIFYVAEASQIKRAYLSRGTQTDSLSALFAQIDRSSSTLPSLRSIDLIPRILDQCLEEAFQERASDIHLEPENKFIRIRLRIDGQLIPYHAFHKDFWDSFCVHLKVCAHMNIAESRLPQNGRFSRQIKGTEVDFRVSTHPTKHGESIVIRVLDRLTALLALEEIGFPAPTVARLKDTLQNKQGLFIVCGPTGSGKTTTLYSILSHLNTPTRNIMTLEQPIEYELPFIRQTEIQETSTFTFAQGVRSILRQDPDILFIGEVRDPETAQMALRASMTGHQVYTTLHAPQALGAIQRLADLGISPTILAGNLKCLLSQRLVRKLCTFCKKQRPLLAQEARLLQLPLNHTLYEPTGCDVCKKTGYKGRFPLVEFIACTDSLNHLILEKAPLSLLEKEARKGGYIPLQEQGIVSLLEGTTSLSELCSVISLEQKET